MTQYRSRIENLLWLTWTALVTINGLDLSARLNMTVKYHKSPSILYNNRPVLVVCSSLHSQDGGLELEISSFEQDSKNSTVQGKYGVRGRVYVSQEMAKMSTRFLPGHSPSNGLFHDSAVFKFCASDIFLYGGVIRCTVEDPTQNLFRYTIEKEFEFKYEPMKPLLKVYYHLAPGIAILGETLLVFCSAYIGSSGKLALTLTSGELNSSWIVTWEQDRYRKNPFGYVTVQKEMTAKGRMIRAKFHFRNILPLNMSLLECHSTDIPDIPSNDAGSKLGVARTTKEEHHLIVKAYPYRPRLRVSSILTDRSRYNPGGVTWILDGHCFTPLTSARRLDMVFINNQMSVVFRVNASMRSQQKSFQRDARGMNRLEVFSIDFRRETKGDKLIGHFKAYLHPDTQWATVSCAVKELQRCQNFRSDSAVRKMASREECEDTEKLIETLAFSLSKSGAAIALVFCAFLFIAVIIQEVIKKLAD